MASPKKSAKSTGDSKPLDEIETTLDIEIPKDLVDQVIGQPSAVRKIKLAMRQRRHFLLVGPPGVGKSMLAQALASHLAKPKEQINVVDNPVNPQKPIVEVIKHYSEVKTVKPSEVPAYVAEQLGFKCPVCGTLSASEISVCPKCNENKYRRITKRDEIKATCFGSDGSEQVITYQKKGDSIALIGSEPESGLRPQDKRKRFTIVPLNRKNFVHATGASETELLGDVRHDPYGGHPEIGTPAYLRVVPGAIHEAHEGVLFIDELPHLDHLQNFILTAMQE
ncbi:MAG: ATP-binding protein, partial [Candidatus Altiarchaeota archaeon]|nr:ATP-binding protein [Candidatus Altiarchaeota archaeon]